LKVISLCCGFRSNNYTNKKAFPFKNEKAFKIPPHRGG
jgi:hypothetical protein